jgi:hypothetical protein
LPDIIINIFATGGTFKKDGRVGFIRIPAASVMRNESKPNWYQVTSIENSQKTVGLLLMNVQLIKHMPKQIAVQRET